MQQSQNNGKSRGGDPMTWVLGCILGGGYIVIWATIAKIIWPLVKWGAKKAWAAATKKADKADEAVEFEEDAEDASSNNLRTPEIFKGAKNLAPMREFKLH